MTNEFFNAASRRAALGSFLVLCLAGCAGSGTAPALRSAVSTITPISAPSSAPTAGGTATARITIVVPGKSAGSVRTRKYVSPSTQSLTIAVDGATPSVVNLTPSSPNCSVAAALDELNCTATLDVAPGSHSFTLVTYDAVGGIGNELSANTVTEPVVMGAANMLSVTLAGIPASIQAVPLPASTDLFGNETAGFAILRGPTQTFDALARDADGNYIIGPGAPTFTATVTGAANATVIAATNGNPSEFALSTVSFGNATLTLTASPAATVAGSPLSVSIPIVSTTITSTFSGVAGAFGYLDGSASTAMFQGPLGTAYDPANGNLYVAQSGGIVVGGADTNCTIRQITPTGTVTTLAGSAGICTAADGTGSAAGFSFPAGIAYDPETNDLYVTDACTIRQVTLAGVVTTIAGGSDSNGKMSANQCGDIDGSQFLAELNDPFGIAYSPFDKNLYITDTNNCQIRQVTTSGTVTTIAGMGPSVLQSVLNPDSACPAYTDGTGTAATFNFPQGIAVDSATGDLYVTDTDNDIIRKVTVAGVVTTIAGLAPTTALPFPGNAGLTDGSGSQAQFYLPTGLAYDSKDGTLYVADYLNCALRQVTLSGVVLTVAGEMPRASCSTLNGLGNQSRFGQINFPAYDPSNDSIFVSDLSYNIIRQVQL